ncbi:hypothetical protein PUN28_009406 [Cardiocondyla obscurior]|uniref:Uncharacterized protein n=1 Tax=Cardiocondyla obscurior TaxID=286306 RepID=A0AAW2FXF2_9HYME
MLCYAVGRTVGGEYICNVLRSPSTLGSFVVFYLPHRRRHHHRHRRRYHYRRRLFRRLRPRRHRHHGHPPPSNHRSLWPSST